MPPKRKSRTPRKTAPATMPAGILTLPVELQNQVISYLTSRKDLKAICRVCKELQAVVTPVLYRTITLPLCSLNEGLKKRLHQGNPGISHIRKLAIVTYHGTYMHGQHGRHLTDLLMSVPKDILFLFRYHCISRFLMDEVLTEGCSLDTGSVVPSEVAYMLRLRQRNLSNFVLHHTSIAPVTDYLPDADELRNVTAISFYLGSKRDAERAAKVLRHGSAINSIALYLPAGTFSGIQRNDACQTVIEALFSDWTKSQKGQKLALKRLFFSAFHFRRCGPLIATVVAPASLDDLIMVNCCDTDALLEGFSQASLNLVTFTDDLSMHEREDSGMVNTFLHSFRGLENLRLTADFTETNGECDWSAIQHHGATLRSLFLDDFSVELMPYDDEGAHDRSMSAFETAMKACTSLKQMAIRAPCPDVFDAEFFEFLDCLKPLRDLRTLRLFVYVFKLEGAWEDDQDSELCPHHANYLVSKAQTYVLSLASAIFQRLHESCPRLVALVIDARYPEVGLNYGDASGCQRSGYLRVMQKDMYGRTTAAAVRCDSSDIKLHEPCCEVVEDSLRFDKML